MENGTIKKLVPYIANAAIKANIAVAIDEDGNEIKGSKKSNTKQNNPVSNKEEKKIVDNKEDNSKGEEIRAFTLTHENAIEVVITSEEVIKTAEEGLKEHPEDKELLKALADGKAELETAQDNVTKAEEALEEAKEGVDKGWLAKVFGK